MSDLTDLIHAEHLAYVDQVSRLDDLEVTDVRYRTALVLENLCLLARDLEQHTKEHV